MWKAIDYDDHDARWASKRNEFHVDDDDETNRHMERECLEEQGDLSDTGAPPEDPLDIVAEAALESSGS